MISLFYNMIAASLIVYVEGNVPLAMEFALKLRAERAKAIVSILHQSQLEDDTSEEARNIRSTFLAVADYKKLTTKDSGTHRVAAY